MVDLINTFWQETAVNKQIDEGWICTWLESFFYLSGAEDICLAMDQSERSYQLLGDYAAGQQLYHLESDHNQIVYIVFDPQRSYGSDDKSIKVKLPILNATEEHLMACK